MFFLVDWVRRALARREPMPSAWRDVLQTRVPFYARFSEEERARFDDKLVVFVRTKHFEGAGGMVVDEEVKVTIAAAAARLVMNLPSEHYQRLSDVVVYRSHYKHRDKEGFVVFGEAFGPGTVVLSYDAVVRGLTNPEDGHDTASHEFAHLLDGADGAFDGTPELDGFEAYGPWAKVMTSEFASLRRGGHVRRQVLRDYGATNEAEFFAVATESFFEKPRQMRDKHPALYEVLAGYFKADPAEMARRPAKPVKPAATGGKARRSRSGRR